MQSLTRIALCVLSVCACASAQPTKLPKLPTTAPASRPAPAEPEVRSFELTPVAPSTPALKYQLLFSHADRIPGNAAVAYLDAALLLAPDSNDNADKALEALEANDRATFAAAADSLDLPSMLAECDVAGRREKCEWDPPGRERGVLTLLPHLQPLTHGVAKVLRVRATRQIEQGKIEDAIATLRLGYELSVKIGTEPVIVSSVVSVGQFGWMNEPLAKLLSHPQSPNLYWTLVEMPPRWPILRRAWDAECGWPYFCLPTLKAARDGEALTAAQWRHAMYDEAAPFYAEYENYRPIGIRAHPDPIKDAGASVVKEAQDAFAKAHGVTPDHAAKDVDPTVVLGEFYFQSFRTAHDETSKLRGLPYPVLLPMARETGKRISAMKKAQPANPFLEVAEMIYRPIERFALADRQWAALTAVEALRSYAAQTGHLPSRTLEDVVETPVPANPATGKPFEYRMDSGKAVLSDTAFKPPLTYTITLRAK